MKKLLSSLAVAGITAFSLVTMPTTSVAAQTVQIPFNQITPQSANWLPNRLLAKTVTEYYGLTPQQSRDTYYAYNKVQLDTNATDPEYFVIVSGPYTSGTGGDSALWISRKGHHITVKQAFTLVHEPVIISEVVVDGHHDFFVPTYGGGATFSYTRYRWNGSQYVAGETVRNLKNIRGKAILANNYIFNTDKRLGNPVLND